MRRRIGRRPSPERNPSNVDSHRHRTHLVAAAHAIVVAAIAATATTLAAATMRAAGVHLAADGRIPLAAFAQFTFAGAVLGGLLVAVLNRRGTLPRRRFIQSAVAITALSCLAPAAVGADVPSKIGLIAIHLLAATIITPVLARQTTR